MIITELMKQEWKKGFRSQSFYKSLAVKILLGIMALYFGVMLFIIGLFLGDILEELHPSLTPLELVNGASLYIILGAIVVRFLLQTLKTIDLQTYQVLPIRRNTIVNFLLLRPLFNVANYVSLVTLVPFAVKSIAAYYSGGIVLQFVIIWVLIIWFNQWLAGYLKRKFSSSFIGFVVGLVLIGGLILLDFFNVFSLFDVSKSVFNFLVIQNPVGWLVVLSLVVLIYLLNFTFFSKHYYLEDMVQSNEKFAGNKFASELTFLDKYGTIGEIIRNQIRLIFRHKRTKSLIYTSAFFLLYGLLFYAVPTYQESKGLLFFCAIVLTGMPMMMFGQWVYSLESNYFDALMTKNISTQDYVKANYFFLLALSVATFILTTPYFLFGIKIVYLHIAAIMFNVGISIPTMLYLSTFNTKRIELNSGGAFNYQGTTYKSFLTLLPIMGLPIVLLLLLDLFLETQVALMLIAGIGLLGIIASKPLLTLCIRQFNNRKYALAEGFREKE